MPNSARTHFVQYRIWEHINRIDEGQMFTNRDFLPYGARSAVDQALRRLMKRGIIIRLARGVYVKEGSRIHSIYEVAKFKANAFGKNVVQDIEFATDGISLVNYKCYVFSTNGCSSSFKYEDQIVHFKRKASRKILSGTSRTSKIIRALWHFNHKQSTDEIIAKSLRWMSRSDKKELCLSLGLIPAWMHKKFGLFRDDYFKREYFFYKVHMPTSGIFKQYQ